MLEYFAHKTPSKSGSQVVALPERHLNKHFAPHCTPPLRNFELIAENFMPYHRTREQALQKGQ